MIQLFIEDTVNNIIYEVPFLSSNYSEKLNKGKNARFNIDYLKFKEIADTYNTTIDFIVTGGFREIYLTKDGETIYLGVISEYQISKNVNNQLQVDISSVDYFALLAKRIIFDHSGNKPQRVFTSTDAGAIAWALINESQTSDNPYSDLGITQGTIQTSKNRDKTFNLETVKEGIEYISNFNLKDGFDFDIDNLKKFNVYYPQKGQNRPNIILDSSNIIGWSFRKPFTLSLTNKVYIVGGGMNDQINYEKRTSATTYRNAFKTLERVERYFDVTTQTLQDKGDAVLTNEQASIPELQVATDGTVVPFIDYEVGDRLTVILPELNINYAYRVEGRDISIDANGYIDCQITFIQ